MPEQSAHPREETESDQQTIFKIIKGEMTYENYRYRRSGRIQCRN